MTVYLAVYTIISEHKLTNICRHTTSLTAPHLQRNYRGLYIILDNVSKIANTSIFCQKRLNNVKIYLEICLNHGKVMEFRQGSNRSDSEDHHKQARKNAGERSTLVLKFMGRITRSPTKGYQWSHQHLKKKGDFNFSLF